MLQPGKKTLPSEESYSDYLKALNGLSSSNSKVERILTPKSTGVVSEELSKLSYLPSSTVSYDDMNRLLGYDQSNWSKAGNTFARLVPNIVTGAVGYLGAMADIEDYAQIDNEAGNWLTKAMNKAKEATNEAFPVYGEQAETLDLGNPNWWFQNGGNLVESMGSFVLAGGVVGALTGGLGLSGTAATVLSGTALTQAESVQSAMDIYDRTYEKAKKAKMYGYDSPELSGNYGTNLSPEEYARELAGRAAANTINVNRANILLNLTSAGMFVKSGANILLKLLEKVSTKRSLDKIGAEAIQEFLEEEVNLIAEKEGERTGGISDKTWRDYLFTDEALEAGILGAIGGAGQTLGSIAVGNINNKAYKGKIANYKEQYEKQQNIVRKEKDILNNPKSLLDNISDPGAQVKAFSEIEKIKAAANKEQRSLTVEEQEQIEDIQARTLEGQVFRAYMNGTLEHLKGVYTDMNNLSEEEAQKRGLHDGSTKPNDVSYYKNVIGSALNLMNDAETTSIELKNKKVNSRLLPELFQKTLNVKRQAKYSQNLQTLITELENKIAPLESEENKGKFNKEVAQYKSNLEVVKALKDNVDTEIARMSADITEKTSKDYQKKVEASTKAFTSFNNRLSKTLKKIDTVKPLRQAQVIKNAEKELEELKPTLIGSDYTSLQNKLQEIKNKVAKKNAVTKEVQNAKPPTPAKPAVPKAPVAPTPAAKPAVKPALETVEDKGQKYQVDRENGIVYKNGKPLKRGSNRTKEILEAPVVTPEESGQPSQQVSEIEAKKAEIAELENKRKEELNKDVSDRFSRVEQQQAELESNQEAPLKVGTPYTEGMKVTATTIVFDENVEGDGYRAIVKVTKPQINTDGAMTQSGEVEVGIFKDKESYDKWEKDERAKSKERYKKRENKINVNYAAQIAQKKAELDALESAQQVSEVESQQGEELEDKQELDLEFVQEGEEEFTPTATEAEYTPGTQIPLDLSFETIVGEEEQPSPVPEPAETKNADLSSRINDIILFASDFNTAIRDVLNSEGNNALEVLQEIVNKYVAERLANKTDVSPEAVIENLKQALNDLTRVSREEKINTGSVDNIINQFAQTVEKTPKAEEVNVEVEIEEAKEAKETDTVVLTFKPVDTINTPGQTSHNKILITDTENEEGDKITYKRSSKDEEELIDISTVGNPNIGPGTKVRYRFFDNSYYLNLVEDLNNQVDLGVITREEADQTLRQQRPIIVEAFVDGSYIPMGRIQGGKSKSRNHIYNKLENGEEVTGAITPTTVESRGDMLQVGKVFKVSSSYLGSDVMNMVDENGNPVLRPLTIHLTKQFVKTGEGQYVYSENAPIYLTVSTYSAAEGYGLSQEFLPEDVAQFANLFNNTTGTDTDGRVFAGQVFAMVMDPNGNYIPIQLTTAFLSNDAINKVLDNLAQGTSEAVGNTGEIVANSSLISMDNIDLFFRTTPGQKGRRGFTTFYDSDSQKLVTVNSSDINKEQTNAKVVQLVPINKDNPKDGYKIVPVKTKDNKNETISLNPREALGDLLGRKRFNVMSNLGAEASQPQPYTSKVTGIEYNSYLAYLSSQEENKDSNIPILSSDVLSHKGMIFSSAGATFAIDGYTAETGKKEAVDKKKEAAKKPKIVLKPTKKLEKQTSKFVDKFNSLSAKEKNKLGYTSYTEMKQDFNKRKKQGIVKDVAEFFDALDQTLNC